MANTPSAPTGTEVSLTLPENAELYWCPAADTLNSGDLIPNTTGDMDIEPQRQVTRTELHNGKDYASVGSLSSNDFTVEAFLTDSDAKLVELKAALNSGEGGKINVFFRDGSGVKGFARVTRIKTNDDPTQNKFSKSITFSPYLVETM